MIQNNDVAEKLARISLKIGAIKFSPDQPFTWASGYKMPIYNDNRLLLGNAGHRTLITQGFQDLLKKCAAKIEVIAGTATAGIPHATTLRRPPSAPVNLCQICDQNPWHGQPG